MFNIIIFLLGAGIMFFMALRSVLARRRLCTQGQKVTATVEGTVQSQDGLFHQFLDGPAQALRTGRFPYADNKSTHRAPE